MTILIQFLLRLTFGLALGMFITSSKLVTSGYFRNHLYVTLGLASLAALLSFSIASEALWYAVAAVIFSYLGTVYWLFEKPKPGKLMLSLVALTSLGGTFFVTIGQFSQWSEEPPAFQENYDLPIPDGHDITTAELEAIAEHNVWVVVSSGFLRLFAHFSSGLLLGLTMAAMLLGHWYLNSPTMDLIPLQRLIIAMGLALFLQFVLSAWGLWCEFSYAEQLSTQWMLFVLLRWTFGLVGVAAMTWMAWQTLKVPNTQSATGILYVAVIGTFVGETMALLLSTESLFPL